MVFIPGYRYAFASLTLVLIRNFVSDHDESITRSGSCFPNTYRIRKFSHEMKTKNSRYLHFFEDQFRSLLNQNGKKEPYSNSRQHHRFHDRTSSDTGYSLEQHFSSKIRRM